MEFEGALHGMYDARLKLRLLSWIMATHVPEDRQPPKSPSDLSIAVSLVRRHRLLSEPDPPHPPGKPLDAYKAAVDSWVDRLSLLLSSSMVRMLFFFCVLLHPSWNFVKGHLLLLFLAGPGFHSGKYLK